MANNVLIYNGVIQGATGGVHTRWLTSTDPNAYLAIRTQIVALATLVDALIPTNGGITLADGQLIESITQSVFEQRYLNTTDSLSSIGQAIVALWTTIRSQFLQATNSIYRWDFEGVIDTAGTLNVPGWAPFNSPAISQRDAGSTHSPQNPGVINVNLDAAAADQSCIFNGPWDFSTVSAFEANVLIPSAGGNELANCAFGFGIVADPLTMDPAANGGVWLDNNAVIMFRSAGASSGAWIVRVETTGTGLIATSGVAVALDTWIKLRLAQLTPGVWTISVNGTVIASRSGAPPSGIAYLGIGGVRTAAAAGRNIAIDVIQLETFPLSR